MYLFYVITGGWWPSQQSWIYIGGLYFLAMSPDRCTGQKAEPCFLIRACESSQHCCWHWKGLVQNRAAPSVFVSKAQAAFCNQEWEGQKGMKPPWFNSYPDKRLTSDLGLATTSKAYIILWAKCTQMGFMIPLLFQLRNNLLTNLTNGLWKIKH